METQPYVGITGIMSREQVKAIDRMLVAMAWPESHRVMYGVLVSGWTLEGAAPTNRQQYPPSAFVANLASTHPRALNLIHYNNGRRPYALDMQLASLKALAPAFDGVQLNFTWPNPIELHRAKQQRGVIVLQLGAAALRETDALAAARWLRSYGGVADYALLDLSGGTGKALQTTAAATTLTVLLQANERYRLGIRFGVAGGLCADRIPELANLLSRFPGLSWDAQSALRDASDQLDMARVKAYLEASLSLIRSTTA